MSEEQQNDKCDHDPCHCVPNPENRVVIGKTTFCSQGCADGKGCHHQHCDCHEAT